MKASSVAAFAQAQQVIPGGVNSPARAYGAVGGGPRFIDRGVGSRLYDIDGREYIDYVCSWGPLIFGHAHPRVVSALREACGKGTSFGAPTQVETELAELIVASVPSIDMVRMVNSGTEATMSAVRLARGFTGRDKVLKFDGCWHGHGDSFLIRAGSSALTLGAPDSPGIPQGVADSTLTVAYNDIEAVRKAAKENSAEIASIIVEPVAGNMGTVLPHDGFLAGLRQVADEEVAAGPAIDLDALGEDDIVAGIAADRTTGTDIDGVVALATRGVNRRVDPGLACHDQVVHPPDHRYDVR